MKTLPLLLQPIKSFDLTAGQKTKVLRTCRENEARVSLRRLRAKIGGQFLIAIDGNEIALPHTARHLLEKSQRHARKLMLKPFVRVVVDVFVKPQGREAGAVSETDLLAHRVFTFMMGRLDQQIYGFRRQRWRMQSPLRVQIISEQAHQGNGNVQLGFGKLWNYRMKSH